MATIYRYTKNIYKFVSLCCYKTKHYVFDGRTRFTCSSPLSKKKYFMSTHFFSS